MIDDGYAAPAQLVVDEEYVGTLLEANEKIVEAIQLFDRVGGRRPSLIPRY
jgi:hypothetical protein